MKQLLQDLSNGQIKLQEVPCPQAIAGHLLVRTATSLVSAGTERMLLEFGKANLIGKARQQPDRVREAWQKVKTDGLLPTVEAVRAKLDQPIALGYCNAGTVLEVGSGVEGFAPGDRVVSNGAHAEAVMVSANLCAKVPAAVSDQDAAFTVLGAIALQGIRLAAPTLGETFVVIGLGLVGQLASQLLRAHGCRVLGIDPDASRADLASKSGAEALVLSDGADPVAAARSFSAGCGVDGVIIAASTPSDEPVHQAALMCRKRGRIVLVGVTGLKLSRADFYEKELSFQVSCSYGPGRYDPRYESGNCDYPLGFVRWTARRNFEAVLEMIALGNLKVGPLVSSRFTLDQANQAYSALASGSSLGILIEYPNADGAAAQSLRRHTIATGVLPRLAPHPAEPIAAVIGAGNFAARSLLPALRQAKVHLKTVVSVNGVSAARMAQRFACEQSSTDSHGAIADRQVNTVVVVTRHDSHAALTCEALKAGKHVFVEKPLALSEVELQQIEKAYQAAARDSGAKLMVGFNRRFSPLTQKMKSLLQGVADPKCFIVTVNAGAVAPDHWTRDRQAGGGRIIGETCHFVDLVRFLAGYPIESVQTSRMRGAGDAVCVTLAFEDGSVATIQYLDNGGNSFPKERIEAFTARRVLALENFRRLVGYNWPGFKRLSLWRQDKGHNAAVEAFAESIRKGLPAPIPFDELVEVTRVSMEISSHAAL
jgi:predicted dehydrogenase/threonine dehydrogenase-like Zn-dependent dehydrogenase